LPSTSGISSTSGGTGKKLLSAKLKMNNAAEAEGRLAHASVQSYRCRWMCHHGRALRGTSLAPQWTHNSAFASLGSRHRGQANGPRPGEAWLLPGSVTAVGIAPAEAPLAGPGRR